METLSALTDKLVTDLRTISHEEKPGYVIYDLEQGEAITFTLKCDKNIHVIDALLTEGTIFPLHQHDESYETLILQSGEVTVLCDEPGCETIRHELKPGQPFMIPSGMKHLLHAKKTSWILATLIPPDNGMFK